MVAQYDLFCTSQRKGTNKERYHPRSVVTGKTNTCDLICTITKRSAFKEGVVLFPIPGNYGVTRD